MFIPKHHPFAQPTGYDLPFTPRYSVPESFRRALSYEGQQHWFIDLFQNLYYATESFHNSVIAFCPTKYTTAQAKKFLDTHVEFAISDVEGGDEHDENPELVSDSDLVLIRFYNTTDRNYNVAVGTLVDACRCTEDERWTVHVHFVAYDLSDRVATLETKVDKLEDDMSKVKSDITNIQGDIANIQGDITNIQGDITTINNTITNIKGDTTDLKSRVTKVENRATKLEERCKDLENRVTVLENRCPEYIIRRYNPDSIGGMQIYNTGRLQWWFTAGRTVDEKSGSDITFDIKCPFKMRYIYAIGVCAGGTYGDYTYVGQTDSNNNLIKTNLMADGFRITVKNVNSNSDYYYIQGILEIAITDEGESMDSALARVDEAVKTISNWKYDCNFFTFNVDTKIANEYPVSYFSY